MYAVHCGRYLRCHVSLLFFLSVFLPIHIFVCPSVEGSNLAFFFLSNWPSVSMHAYSILLYFISLFVLLFLTIKEVTHFNFHQVIHLSVHSSICLSIQPSFCPFIHPSNQPASHPIYLSIHPSPACLLCLSNVTECG